MTKLYRLKPQIKTEYNYSVLTTHDNIEYQYRLIKKQVQLRYIMNKQYPDVADENLSLPYGFIIGILKHYVHHIDANRPPSQQGDSEKILLMAQSPKKGFSVALLVSMENYLLTVYDVQKIDNEIFSFKDVTLYPEVEHYYLETLNLDTYIREVKLKKREYEKIKRKKILNKTKQFHKEEGFLYLYKISKHVNKKRSSTKKQRLTLVPEAIANILYFLVTDEKSKKCLSNSIKEVEEEKKVALIFYNRDKTHLIGMVVALNVELENTMVVTIVTMYDNVPKEKTIQMLLFPKLERIVLYDYDLDSYMTDYDLEYARKEKKRKLMVRQQLEESKKGSNIIKISSIDEYYIINNRFLRKANNKNLNHRKVKKVQVRKHSIPMNQIASIEKDLCTTNIDMTNNSMLKIFIDNIRKIFVDLIDWFKSLLTKKVNR